MRKATMTKRGARGLLLERGIRDDQDQHVDLFVWVWVKAFNSLAHSFSCLSELDLQDLPLVSTRPSQNTHACVSQNIPLSALTPALPRWPGLRVLCVSHHLDVYGPQACLMLEELANALESLPALKLYLTLEVVAVEVRSSNSDRNLCASIRALGTALGRLPSLTGLAIGCLPATVIGDTDITRQLAELTALESLSLNANLGFADVACWSSLTRLTRLSLQPAGVFTTRACDALQHLPSRLPRLQDLRLGSGGLLEPQQAALLRGVAAATGLTRLAFLIEGIDLRDAALEGLSRLRDLADLSLFPQRLTGEFMARIAPVAPLTCLGVLKARFGGPVYSM